MRTTIEDSLRQMAEGGLIEISESESSLLLANVWVVSTYWAVYLSLQEGADELGSHQIYWGLKQVASLFRPYLSEEAEMELDTILESARGDFEP